MKDNLERNSKSTTNEELLFRKSKANSFYPRQNIVRDSIVKNPIQLNLKSVSGRYSIDQQQSSVRSRNASSSKGSTSIYYDGARQFNKDEPPIPILMIDHRSKSPPGVFD